MSWLNINTERLFMQLKCEKNFLNYCLHMKSSINDLSLFNEKRLKEYYIDSVAAPYVEIDYPHLTYMLYKYYMTSGTNNGTKQVFDSISKRSDFLTQYISCKESYISEYQIQKWCKENNWSYSNSVQWDRLALMFMDLRVKEVRKKAKVEEKVLTKKYQEIHDEFVNNYENYDITCTCHIAPPCGYCTHPGNPSNLEETPEAWLTFEEVKDVPIEDPFEHLNNVTEEVKKGIIMKRVEYSKSKLEERLFFDGNDISKCSADDLVDIIVSLKTKLKDIKELDLKSKAIDLYKANIKSDIKTLTTVLDSDIE